jgi:hypothetical protein
MYKKNTNIVGCTKKKSSYLHKKWFKKWRLGEALLLDILFFLRGHVKFNVTISYFNFWREYIERRPSLLGETMYKKNTNTVGCMKKKSFYLHKKWF